MASTACIAILTVVFGATTLLALESGEVVTLTTFDRSGRAYESRVWLARELDDGSPDGESLLIEAAEPEKAFYRRLVASPQVRLDRGGMVKAYIAEPDASPAGHARIRRLLAVRYGWRDRWIGWFVDTSRSVAVRLRPVESARAATP